MKVGNRDINAFISPELNAGVTDKMSKGEKAQKILSNFGQQVSVKVNRIMHKIETLFSGGEWVNNKAVMSKLTKNIGELKSKLNDVKTTSFDDTARIRQELKEMRGICDQLKQGGVKEAKLKALTEGLEEAIKETASKDDALTAEHQKVHHDEEKGPEAEYLSKHQMVVHKDSTGVKDLTPKQEERTGFKFREKERQEGIEEPATRIEGQHKKDLRKADKREADAVKYAGVREAAADRKGITPSIQGKLKEKAQLARDTVAEKAAMQRTPEERQVFLKETLTGLLKLVDADPAVREKLGKWRGSNSSENKALNEFLKSGKTDDPRAILEIMEKGLVATGKAQYKQGNSGDINIDRNTELGKAHERAIDAYNATVEE